MATIRGLPSPPHSSFSPSLLNPSSTSALPASRSSFHLGGLIFSHPSSTPHASLSSLFLSHSIRQTGLFHSARWVLTRHTAPAVVVLNVPVVLLPSPLQRSPIYSRLFIPSPHQSRPVSLSEPITSPDSSVPPFSPPSFFPPPVPSVHLLSDPPCRLSPPAPRVPAAQRGSASPPTTTPLTSTSVSTPPSFHPPSSSSESIPPPSA